MYVAENIDSQLFHYSRANLSRWVKSLEPVVGRESKNGKWEENCCFELMQTFWQHPAGIEDGDSSNIFVSLLNILTLAVVALGKIRPLKIYWAKVQSGLVHASELHLFISLINKYKPLT